MGALGLLFVGSVLLVNGLVLLGRVDAAAAAPINLFVGALLVVVVLYLALPATDDLTPVFSAAGFLLFGFVYLYVGILNLTGHAGTGAGWYCAWAAGVSLVIALVSFLRDGDVKFGVLWLLWSLLFSMFFVVLGLGLTQFTVVTGWITVVESVITATIPGSAAAAQCVDRRPGPAGGRCRGSSRGAVRDHRPADRCTRRRCSAITPLFFGGPCHRRGLVRNLRSVEVLLSAVPRPRTATVHPNHPPEQESTCPRSSSRSTAT